MTTLKQERHQAFKNWWYHDDQRALRRALDNRMELARYIWNATLKAVDRHFYADRSEDPDVIFEDLEEIENDHRLFSKEGN